MENKKKFQTTPVTFGVILLTVGVVCYLVICFDYTFIPANELILYAIMTALIILLTVSIQVSKNMWVSKSVQLNPALNNPDVLKTPNELTTAFSVLLPFIAILFTILTGFATDIATWIYVMHSSAILVCSLVLFFSHVHNKILKVILGIIYLIVTMLIFMWFLIMLIFSDFGANTVVKSELSPGVVFRADIIDSDQGALGGSTIVEVTRQNRDINLFIGKLGKKPQLVYIGRWGEYETMVLHWESDEILYINEGMYEISD